METKEYTTIDRDKLGWLKGEWDSEPDKVQWQDEETGMPCLAVRHPTSGHWCGYVGVNENHTLYEKHYDEAYVEVHGGLTFADKCQPSNDESKGVCHIPSPGEHDHVWWFGFDCAHCDDLSVYKDAYRYNGATYKNLYYVKSECRSLAKQLVVLKQN